MSEDLKAWIGRSETLHDASQPRRWRRWPRRWTTRRGAGRAALPLPPLWHWLYFLPLHRQREIGPDGHARRGGFLPPVPLPRRMWAGSQFEFRAPLRVGDARRSARSTIATSRASTGRSGALVFVKVRHELRCNGAAEPALRGVPRHRLPRRAAARRCRRRRRRPRPPARLAARVVPDDVLLFRYCALTFNGHRIHYDRPLRHRGRGLSGPGRARPADRHAAAGPAAPPCARGRACAASASRPCGRPSTGTPLRVNGAPQADGKTVQLWAQDHEGWLTMDAIATLR